MNKPVPSLAAEVWKIAPEATLKELENGRRLRVTCSAEHVQAVSDLLYHRLPAAFYREVLPQPRRPSSSMNRIEQWRWRIQGHGGRWTTTRYYATEDDIRVEHPEAEKVEGSMRVVDVPDDAGPGHGAGVG